MAYKEVKVIKNNPSLKGMAVLVPDVIYSTAHGEELKMTLIEPWKVEGLQEQKKYPCIVFVQGSAWTFPDINYELPQLAQFAREGYVVATLTHRNCLKGHPFPAYLQDVKTAIRYLRKHASEHQIDPNRVGIWGTSSGGNTALLVGLTRDEARYKTQEYTEVSDSVKMVVDCFGPTDLTYAIDHIEHLEIEGMKEIFSSLRGEDTKENVKKLQDMNPVNHIEPGKEYPPFLILQGDEDTLVEYAQSELMYHRLSDADADATLIRVEGAPHEGSFWSNELLELIKEFIDKNL